MRVAILQSCYIPWKGYFDIIGQVDIFVVYDDVQYRKNHWHNRNRIKGPNGPQWLTIPVSKSLGSFHSIDAMQIARPFAENHWKTIEQFYYKSRYFQRTSQILVPLFERSSDIQFLSQVNMMFIQAITEELGFETKFVWSNSLVTQGAKSDRILSICETLGASRYLSGPAARAYLEVDKFAEAEIEVEWMDYYGYPEYPQLYGPFDHQVSIIDLLFNMGEQAGEFMKSRRP